MKYIKMCLFFLGVLFSMALIGFSGLISIIGLYGIFTYLLEHCSEILIGSGLFAMGIVYAPIGWSIFCKCADKLKDS